MKTLLPILKTKLFLLGFVSTCTVILATTVPQIRNFITPEKASGEKITTEQKKIAPKIKKQKKTVSASTVTSRVSFEMNNSFETTLTSDAEDYFPGTTATLTGSGFLPEETVRMQVLHADYHEGDPIGDDHEPWYVQADTNGYFVTTWHVCEDDCVGETLRATADGQDAAEPARHAELLFKDGNVSFKASGLPNNANLTVNYSFPGSGLESTITFSTGASGNATSGPISTGGTNANPVNFYHSFPTTVAVGTDTYNFVSSNSTSPVSTTNAALTITGTYELAGGFGGLTITAPTCAQGGSFTITYSPQSGSDVTETRTTPFTFNVKKNTSYSITTTQSPVNGNTYTGAATVTGTTPNTNGFTQTETLTYVDNTLPTIICPSAQDLNLNTSCSATVPDYTGLATASDNCGTPTITQASPVIGSTVNGSGAFTVVLKATDEFSNTNTCSFTVNKKDVTPPTANCKSIDLNLSAAGTATIVAADIDNGSSDVCGAVTLSASKTSFSCTDIGPNTVKLTVTDGSNNTATCNATVTVKDVTLPTANCKSIDLNLSAAGTATIVAADIDNGSSDVCGAVTLSASKTSFSCTDIGPNTVKLTVTDGSNNTATCNATVTVKDVTPPTANCKSIDLNLSAAGTATIVAADIDNGSSDVCGAVTLSASKTSFSCTDIGPNTVKLTVTDGSNNTATCNATVTVKDVTPPTANCKSIDLNLSAAGTATIVAADIDNGSSDVCGTVTLSASKTSFSCTDIGPNTVKLTVTDGSNNTATCNATVTVKDVTPPTANCKSIDLNLSAAGTATIVAADIDNGSSDVCGAVTLSASKTSFSCTDIGPNTVKLTVTDGSNNTATCNATVAVKDVTPPTANCKSIDLNLSAAGTATIVAADIDNGSSDVCGAVTLSASKTSFSCTDIGPNTVKLTVTDGSNNTATCNATVTVKDVTPPTANCKSIDLNLSAAGAATIVAADIDNGSSDVCGAVTLSASKTSFSCTDIGPNTVKLTVTDGSNNTATCNATVTVKDVTPPTANCKSIDLNLSAAGTATIVAGDINNGSSDVCGAVTLSASKTYFNCTNIGPNTVKLTVTDGSNNTATCNATVAVKDVTPPTANCKSIDLNLSAAGTATIVAADIDNGSSDVCGAVTLSASKTSFSCTDIGPNTVKLTVTDGSNNTATCNATVTVKDVTPPTANCKSIDLNLSAAGTATIVAGDINNGSSDVCGAVTLSASKTSFSCTDIGPNTVKLTVTDGSNNTATCNATVTVKDVTPPTANCKSIDLNLSAAGTATIVAADIDNGSSDVCGAVTLSASKTSFSCTDIGPNTVKLTVTDGSNNTATCNATVTVKDVTPPTANCKSIDLNLSAAGTATIVAADIDNGSFDVCGAVTLSASKTSFSCTDIGSNTVKLTVTDGSNNTATCNATVTVKDVTPPTANCKSIDLTLNAAGTATIVAADIDNGSSDICGAVTLSASKTSFSCTDIGPNTVKLTVTDGSNNTATCNATVTVKDVTPPTANCKSIDLNLSAAGAATIVAADIDNGSSDVCGAVTLSASKTSFSCTDIGPNTVKLTVTDGSNNTATCNATVTVKDVTPPTANCKSIDLNLSAAGTATIVAGDINNGSSDVCGAVTLSASKTSFSCTDIGPNTVKLTVTDGSNNTATCNATVTVKDVTPPTANCKSIDLNLSAAGTATIVAGDIDNGSSDVCGAVTLSASKTSFSCTDIGPNTVKLTVTDGSNNTATCNATVTVKDVTPPVITCPSAFNAGTNTACTYVGAFGTATGTDQCDASVAITNNAPAAFPLGGTTVVWKATDDAGNTATCSQLVTINDDDAPIITSVTVNPNCLWPPNHKMRDVSVALTATDNCTTSGAITWAITNVTSNEPVNGTGDGSTGPDWTFSEHSLQLRAEREGTGNGRVYTITFTATDGGGNTSTQSATVCVAHNITSPGNGNAYKVGSTVNFAGTFWDVAGKKHTAKWIIDGASVSGIVVEPVGLKNGTVTGSYKFTTPGVYKLQMNVTDQSGITSSVSTNGDLEAIVVIYDPNGGYTYGSGCFVSPLNAIPTNPTFTGPVSYGFQSNYYKGATNPKGETQFDFRAGDLEFNALNFDYLVVNGSNAQFKGSGKIIGDQSGYNFIMTVIDGDAPNGGGVDKIRMKIYNKNTGQVMYDNMPGAGDADLPTTIVCPESIIRITDPIIPAMMVSSRQIESAPVVPQFNVKVFPNPSLDLFSLYLEGANNDKVHIVVYDALGREVKKFEKEGGNIPVIFGRDLKGGVYFVEVRQGENHKTIKLMKQN